MSCEASVEAASIVAEVVEPEVENQVLPSTGYTEEDWLCAWCLTPVANERDRFAYNGKDEFTFSNPEGIRFEIITFSETHGCHDSGVPTLEHTWFPGYAWSFCQCAQCGRHLGWFYIGPQQFAALIKERIVRGSWARN